MTAPAFIYTSEPWAALSLGRPIFAPAFTRERMNLRGDPFDDRTEALMKTSYVRHDHRKRHRYRSRLCARQHGRDHRVPVGRVRHRMVHWSAAPAPPRTERRRVTKRAPDFGTIQKNLVCFFCPPLFETKSKTLFFLHPANVAGTR
jgi:hypothetical protein